MLHNCATGQPTPLCLIQLLCDTHAKDNITLFIEQHSALDYYYQESAFSESIIEEC